MSKPFVRVAIGVSLALLIPLGIMWALAAYDPSGYSMLQREWLGLLLLYALALVVFVGIAEVIMLFTWPKRSQTVPARMVRSIVRALVLVPGVLGAHGPLPAPLMLVIAIQPQSVSVSSVLVAAAVAIVVYALSSLLQRRSRPHADQQNHASA